MDHATRTSTSSASSTRVVDVLVPVALNQAYSYRVPRGMELKPGDVVCVPLGPREVVAVVWAENANPDPRLHNRLKDVGEKLDVPPLKEDCAASSIGSPTTPCRRAAWCCAWPCGWAKILGLSGCGLACGWWASRRGV